MKKLLGLLAATGLVASTGATVVACGDKVDELGKVALTKDKLEDTVKDVKIAAFVDKKTKLEFASDKADKSIVTTQQVTEFTKDVLKTDVKIGLKAETAALTAEVKEVITVKYDGKEIGKINVTIAKDTTNVAPAPAPEQEAGTITAPANLTGKVGDADKTITVEVKGEVGKLTVKSDKEAVATAKIDDKTITIKFVAVGESKITIKSEKKDVKSVEFNVTVEAAAATEGGE
ncbi:hypothetical protein SCLARK_001661 [Spiroplasma clarkii]|uniref:Lipoprotein n=1 Tax=Spiroplasma clarkii TaxID=2139 RepID=A0A1Y0L363_9MOLU|nr:lipoprotein [Spiroplasma clarkii]ARU92129.1 hypothetical protein SCLARK_001661 [Spiroplasma clarkii]ATX71465.1 hypothetical protein SCLAR_v1c11650 [Spiroplasma clarkii]